MIYWYPLYSEGSSFWSYANTSIQRTAWPRELSCFTSCCYGQTALAGALDIFHSFRKRYACHPLMREFLCVSVGANIHVHFQSLSFDLHVFSFCWCSLAYFLSSSGLWHYLCMYQGCRFTLLTPISVWILRSIDLKAPPQPLNFSRRQDWEVSYISFNELRMIPTIGEIWDIKGCM